MFKMFLGTKYDINQVNMDKPDTHTKKVWYMYCKCIYVSALILKGRFMEENGL